MMKGDKTGKKEKNVIAFLPRCNNTNANLTLTCELRPKATTYEGRGILLIVARKPRWSLGSLPQFSLKISKRRSRKWTMLDCCALVNVWQSWKMAKDFLTWGESFLLSFWTGMIPGFKGIISPLSFQLLRSFNKGHNIFVWRLQICLCFFFRRNRHNSHTRCRYREGGTSQTQKGFNHRNNWQWKEIIFHANIYLGAAKEPFESGKSSNDCVWPYVIQGRVNGWRELFRKLIKERVRKKMNYLLKYATLNSQWLAKRIITIFSL